MVAWTLVILGAMASKKIEFLPYSGTKNPLLLSLSDSRRRGYPWSRADFSLAHILCASVWGRT